MDYDAVIRDAAKAICKARYGHLRGFEGRERTYEKEARAAAPILMEYGARLALDQVFYTTAGTNASPETIDYSKGVMAATIVKEAVK